MKQLLLITPVIAVILSGCGKNEENVTVDQINESVQETGQKVADKSQEAWDKLQSSTYDERQSIKSFLGDSAERLQEEASALISTAGNKSSDAWNTAKANYMAAQAEFEEQLSKLDQATDENWEQVKSSTAEAWQNVEEAFRDLKDSQN